MRDFRVYRTARTKKPCDSFGCYGRITPGERYLRASLPPNSDMGNTTWWSMNICSGCMTPEPVKGGAK